MKVSKVKVGRNNVTVEYTDSLGNKITHKGEFMAHPDLVAAMERLTEHFCALTEQADVVPIDADKFGVAPSVEEVCKNITVTSVCIKNGENGEKAIIYGYRTLSTGRILSLQSPSLNLDIDDYDKRDELSATIDGVFAEAEEYVGGKHGGFEQKSIDFDAEEGADPFDNDEE